MARHWHALLHPPMILRRALPYPPERPHCHPELSPLVILSPENQPGQAFGAKDLIPTPVVGFFFFPLGVDSAELVVVACRKRKFLALPSQRVQTKGGGLAMNKMNKKQLILVWCLAGWTVLAFVIAGVDCWRPVDCSKAPSIEERARCDRVTAPLPVFRKSESQLDLEKEQERVERQLRVVENDIGYLEERNLRIGLTDAEWSRLKRFRHEKMALVLRQGALRDEIRREEDLATKEAQRFREVYTITKCGWDWRRGRRGSSLRELILLVFPALVLAVPLWLTFGRQRG